MFIPIWLSSIISFELAATSTATISPPGLITSTLIASAVEYGSM